METLRQLAQDGHTVICSIHQPRGSVYVKFDDIVLLTEGALVYAGPASEEPLAYFSKFGLLAEPCLLYIHCSNAASTCLPLIVCCFFLFHVAHLDFELRFTYLYLVHMKF